MGLSCSCDWEDEDAAWYWWAPEAYTTFKLWRRKKCCCAGCNTMIKSGDITGEVRRTRCGTDWEDNNGIADTGDPESVTLASVFMCEECTDLLFSFQDLGFDCVSPYENMRELAREYHNDYQSE